MINTKIADNQLTKKNEIPIWNLAANWFKVFVWSQWENEMQLAASLAAKLLPTQSPCSFDPDD